MYILLCSDNSYYVGSTNDPEYRLQQHVSGEGSRYTKKRLPVKLVYCEWFPLVCDAFAREHQVKRWRRDKKEALINQKYKILPALSKNRQHFNSHRSET